MNGQCRSVCNNRNAVHIAADDPVMHVYLGLLETTECQSEEDGQNDCIDVEASQTVCTVPQRSH